MVNTLLYNLQAQYILMEGSLLNLIVKIKDLHIEYTPQFQKIQRSNILYSPQLNIFYICFRHCNQHLQAVYILYHISNDLVQQILIPCNLKHISY